MSEANQPRLHSVNDGARFTAGADTIDNGSTPPGGSTPPPSKFRATKTRPNEPIPTDRLSFEKQLEVAKAVASMSGNNRRGVDSLTMSAAVELKGETGGLNSRFFRSAGWFESVGRGQYTASSGLLKFWRHVNVSPDEIHAATEGMREEVKESWFWKAAGPMLEGGHPVKAKAIVLQLATAANANDHVLQIETIIEWLEWVGLVRRSDGMIQIADDSALPVEPIDEQATDDEVGTGEIDPSLGKAGSDAEDVVPVETGDLDRPYGLGRTVVEDDAIISFNVSVRLTKDDVQNLNEDQMKFIMGLADKLRG